MDIGWIEAVIYGIVSGLTEYVPVSSQAHQLILRSLFGFTESNPFLNLFSHVGMLTGLLITSGGFIRRLFNEYRYSKSYRRRRKREVNLQAVFDINFVKAACIPMLIALVAYTRTMRWEDKIPIVALFLLLNGIILLVPMYLARGNKDSRNMSALDAVLFGIGASISVLPGVSRIGAGCSVAILRGADPYHAYKWGLILSIPVLIVLICFDIVSVFGIGLAGVGLTFVLKCILCGIFSHIASSLAITLMKSLTVRSGISGFSYYCWGAALFAFVIYLY